MKSDTEYWFVLIVICLVLYAGLMAVVIVGETSSPSNQQDNGRLITISTVTPTSPQPGN